MADPGNTTTSVAPRASWVSVADLLGGQVPVHSSEAVAVVAALCAVLLERGAQVVPDPPDVLINGEGKLAVRAHDGGDPNAVAIGRMLHNLLATASPPAALRLFVTHAISSDRYNTVSAFADALASYEAAGRETLIQSAHDRWVAARTGATASAEIPMRAHPEEEKKPKAKTAGRRVPRSAIAAAAVAVALGGAASAWLATGAKAPSIPALSLASLSASVPTAIQQAFAWISTSAPSPIAAAEPETEDTKRPRAAKGRSANASARTSNPDLDAATATAFLDATTAGSIALADVTVGSDDVTTAHLVMGDSSTDGITAGSEGPDLRETSAAPEDAAAIADATVYTRAYLGVMPPVMVTRQLAPPEALSPGLETISTIEVLVGESGDVEHVKLLSRPSPILATMLLSAAKTWKFRPALNDGHPVRYRLRVDVATTRP